MDTAVTTVPQGERRSVLVSMASRFGMEPQAFEATLRATVVPANASREQFAAFLLVAKEYGLNPLTKEIYAFPTRGGGIQPIVGVDGWANLINSHPSCDGFEFVDSLTDKGELISITCRIYRKDRAHPVEATEYMAECKRATDTWKQWPRRMLRHKALIQAARYAFGFSGIIDPDEWERHPEREDEPREVRQARPKAVVVQAPSSGSRKALPPIVGEVEAATITTDDAYQAGREARHDRVPFRTSPYETDAETESWRKGWQDADREFHTGEAPHDPETGEIIDAEPEATVPASEPPFDPEVWLKDVETALSGAKTAKQLKDAWRIVAEPRKADAFPPDWSRAERIYMTHEERVGG